MATAPSIAKYTWRPAPDDPDRRLYTRIPTATPRARRGKIEIPDSDEGVFIVVFDMDDAPANLLKTTDAIESTRRYHARRKTPRVAAGDGARVEELTAFSGRSV